MATPPPGHRPGPSAAIPGSRAGAALGQVARIRLSGPTRRSASRRRAHTRPGRAPRSPSLAPGCRRPSPRRPSPGSGPPQRTVARSRARRVGPAAEPGTWPCCRRSTCRPAVHAAVPDRGGRSNLRCDDLRNRGRQDATDSATITAGVPFALDRHRDAGGARPWGTRAVRDAELPGRAATWTGGFDVGLCGNPHEQLLGGDWANGSL
jgi:hypothetical protein